MATGGGIWAALKGWWQTLGNWTPLELTAIFGGGIVAVIFFVVFVRAVWPQKGARRAPGRQADPPPEIANDLEGLRELRNQFLDNLHHVTAGHRPDPSEGNPVGVILLKLRTQYSGHRLIAYLAGEIPKKPGCQDVLIPRPACDHRRCHRRGDRPPQLRNDPGYQPSAGSQRKGRTEMVTLKGPAAPRLGP